MFLDESLPIIFLGYLMSKKKLVYNKKWDKTAKLQLDSKVESNDF